MTQRHRKASQEQNSHCVSVLVYCDRLGVGFGQHEDGIRRQSVAKQNVLDRSEEKFHLYLFE